MSVMKVNTTKLHEKNKRFHCEKTWENLSHILQKKKIKDIIKKIFEQKNVLKCVNAASRKGKIYS